MFGEADSESPRVPSPWDSLTSAPPSPPQYNANSIPKLVPEAEEGNVEYKLQLLSPSPARFARLVTQLKWRLLEGGGQAYYELGVADSGTLVGLPRQQLEESLETLEMMAGEIGASVIVVKEIEVPPELSSLAESQLERWDGRRSTRRKDMLRLRKRDESPTTSTTEAETEFSTTDVTDVEEAACSSPVASPPSLPRDSDLVQVKAPPVLSSSDSALATFPMDLTEDVADYADNETLGDDADLTTEFLSLEISAVYKPRPMKKRAAHTTHSECAKRKTKNGHLPSKPAPTSNTVTCDDSETFPPSGVKSQFRGDKRDKGRELKHNTLLTHVPTIRSTELPTGTSDYLVTPPSSMGEPSSSGLGSPSITSVDSSITDTSGTTTIASKEPRLIVEVLVVRKLSLDEAFLDFEGFSLQ